MTPKTPKTDPAADNSPDIAALQSELETLRGQLEEKESQLLRTAADLQNVRRRANEDRIRLPQVGAENILQTLLPCLDTIELALKNKPDQATDWTRGVETIFTSLLTALESQGIERIEQTGVVIDPSIHEAVTTDGGETVVEILQTGYRLHDKVVRPAKVRIGKE